MNNGPVPWTAAVKVAERLAGSYPLYDSYHRAALIAEAEPLVARAQELVEAETGLGSVGVPTVEVVDRGRWIERNVAFFSKIVDATLTQPQSLVKRIGGPIVAAETGALLGVLARRVLGQYELVLPSEDAGDTIYLVGPNILAMERSNQFRPSEFRMWIALHECTHRLQFTAVPWMRDYFFDLVTSLAAASQTDEHRLASLGSELRKASDEGRPLIDESGLFGLFANEDQRQQLDKIQALMSLLEGHGHVIMDRVGMRILRTQARMSSLLKARRADPRMAAFMRFTGLEMKMRQYELGEQFVLGVERLANFGALDLAWTGPEALPTLTEIESPELWLRRVS
ncbi:MAG: zinc-dependent metalloprotease [Acidimicrobiia bacterium]|nr:zinc-dependent metalloprotease [Acidimicrobiia bacterium]